jgi:hypothetical protein
MTVETKITTASDLSGGTGVIGEANDRFYRIETALLGTDVSYVLTGTTDTMTSEEWYSGGVIRLTGSPSGNHTLTVPTGERRVTIINETTVEVTVTIAAQSATPPKFPPKSAESGFPLGQEARIKSDGSNVAWEGVPTFAMSDAEYAALSSPDARALYITV